MFRTKMLARLVISVLVATTGQPLVAGEPVGATPPAKSIHEWKSTPVAAPAGCPVANPAAMPSTVAPVAPAATAPAKPTLSAAGPKSPVTISIKSTLREGDLVIVLDDVPIFNEKFQKPFLVISQTTTWDPLQVPAGKHTLSAKVYGTKKTYFSATYDLDVSGTKASALRFVMQGDKLTVELAS